MQLFYNPDLLADSTEFSVSKQESRHIVRSLRMKQGDKLAFTNGKGWLFDCTLKEAHEKSAKILIDRQRHYPSRKLRLHLAVAPTKMNDRFEWFLEKATEIGVEDITPLICKHSERKQIKEERMKKIMESAMKQSQQLYLPFLHPVTSFETFTGSPRNGKLFIAHCMDDDKRSLKEELSVDEAVTILIGPEGDFSVKEIETALDAGYIPVNLGRNRLRTETAAVVACHTIALHYD